MTILYLIIILYTISISFLAYGFSIIKPYKTAQSAPKTRFSIVVPVRDEEQNLPKLLQSFALLEYPTDLFEVLIIDDASAQKPSPGNLYFKVIVVNNERISASPKKDAVCTALRYAAYDWIITTDADCTVEPGWLATLDDCIQTRDVEMIAGAVSYTAGGSFLHGFQQLDLAALQGATIGSFGLKQGFMCNGANFAYTSRFFALLGGFDGNASIASGDDVFLLQKAIVRFPEKVHYLKSTDTIVSTQPLTDWKSLFSQRVRWAAKTSAYESMYGKVLALVVFAGNLSLVLALLLTAIGMTDLFHLTIMAVLKFTADFILISKANSFLHQKAAWFLPACLLYPFFSIAVALYALFGNYEWKGRRYRQ